MRFKSAKFWFKPCAELSLILASTFISGSAFALTVSPMSNDGMTPLNNTPYGMSLFYFPTNAITQTANLFLDTSDPSMPGHLFDLTQDQKTQLLFNGATVDLIRFQVTSTVAITPPTPPAGNFVTVFAGGVGGSHLVPIAFTEFSPFSANSGGNCGNVNCQGSVISGNGYTYYLSVPYNNPGIPVQVGIYPKDVCAYYNYVTHGQDATGCLNGVPSAANGAMALTFAIVPITDASLPTNVPTDSLQAPAPLDQAALSVQFVTSGSVIGCPSYTDIYFPGDTQILFNANTGNNLFTVTTQGPAPITGVVVVGNEKPKAASQTGNYGSNNSVSQFVTTGPAQPVLGFTNTTTGTDHAYNLGFMLRDAAGLIAANSCGLTNVQTATIQGFLKQSGCFIATAAFDSIDAAPVEMLRNFRDRVLLHSGPGKMFVSWYYRWSPDAAEWLLRHPLFRFPVLLALIPLEVIAWLVLHPAWMALLAALNIFIFVRGMRSWKGALGEG